MLLVRLLVNFLLKMQPARLPRLHKRNEKVPALEEDLGRGLLGCPSRLAVSEADKGHGGILVHLDVVDVAELREEVCQLLLCRGGVNVLHYQVHVHHRLLPLIGLFGHLLLPLLLALEFANVQAALQLIRQLLEVVEGAFRVLPIAEADEAEPTRRAV